MDHPSYQTRDYEMAEEHNSISESDATESSDVSEDEESLDSFILSRANAMSIRDDGVLVAFWNAYKDSIFNIFHSHFPRSNIPVYIDYDVFKEAIILDMIDTFFGSLVQDNFYLGHLGYGSRIEIDFTPLMSFNFHSVHIDHCKFYGRDGRKFRVTMTVTYF